MSKRTLAIAAMAVLALSCDTMQWPGFGPGPGPAVLDPVRLEPLPVQQLRAYPETSTGRFVSLADFEDTPLGPRGTEQVKDFAIEPAPGAEGSIKYEVNITRTGVGAIEVVLPHKGEMVFNLPTMHDFADYTLVSFALYSQAVRDDLVVSLATDAATWTSPRTLIEPGWNNVLIDIQRLGKADGFDIHSVRSLRLRFVDAGSPVTFNLDDVMAVDNRRAIKPVPEGVTLEKNGLDYSLKLPGRDKPLLIAQGADGLWRLGAEQPIVQLGEVGRILAGRDEAIAIMGQRKIGRLRVLENNAIRVRLENAWYFPSRPGEWASMAVRQIRWEHTFYGDGRMVTHVELNNSGGADIGPMRMILGCQGAWMGKDIAAELSIADMRTGVGRWDWLTVPGDEAKAVCQGYLKPGQLKLALAADGVFAPGDLDRDGFDESQGCYVLGARAGNCRFTIQPTAAGVRNPVFRVIGKWDGPVTVNVEGRLLGEVVRLADGSALFVIEGWVRRPTVVEVSGKDATGPS